jgi:photosystem II stability/assembly factor-like uncharacterized protein
MSRFEAARYSSKLVSVRTVAFRAVVFIGALGWLNASLGAETEFALLPALKSNLAEQGLLLDVARTSDRLLVAGEQGHILFSDDDGQTWTQADVPVSLAITSVAFAGPGKAWATAHDGFLLNSADNGTTWQVKLTGSDVAQLSVKAIEERIEEQRSAVAAATPETREDLEWALEDSVFALEEAAAAVDEGMTSPMLTVWFANDRDGYALGAYGIFLRTRDGGETWVMDGNRLDNPDKYHLYDIARSSAGTLLVAGEAGTLSRSLDAGDSWQRIEAIYAGSFFGAIAASDGSLLIFGLRGNVFRSTDEGESWEQVDTGDQRTLMCGTATDNGSIILAGSAGAVLHSRDNGQSFTVVPTEGGRVYSSITTTLGGNLLLVGFGGISTLDSIVDAMAQGNHDE